MHVPDTQLIAGHGVRGGARGGGAGGVARGGGARSGASDGASGPRTSAVARTRHHNTNLAGGGRPQRHRGRIPIPRNPEARLAGTRIKIINHPGDLHPGQGAQFTGTSVARHQELPAQGLAQLVGRHAAQAQRGIAGQMSARGNGRGRDTSRVRREGAKPLDAELFCAPIATRTAPEHPSPIRAGPQLKAVALRDLLRGPGNQRAVNRLREELPRAEKRLRTPVVGHGDLL